MVIRKLAIIGLACLLAGLALGVPAGVSAHGAPKGFVCADQSGGVNTFAPITAVGVARNPAFDSFTVQFGGPVVPTFTVHRQPSSSFVLDPSGMPVTLQGHAGLRLVMSPASGMGTYPGPTDFRPHFPALRRARLLGDFEAVTSWGLGITHQSCIRTFVLSSPSRLVVDIHH
jgi:hypothetical protein